MPVVHAPQSHLKRNHFTSKQSATTSRHNSHLLSNDLASTVYTLSQAFPPPSLTSLQHVSMTSVGIYHHTPTYYHQRCPCWVPANHMRSEGGSCSLCIDGIEQAANYKTTPGPWLFVDVATVLLPAEWGKWACQPSPKLLCRVQMRYDPGILMGSSTREGGAGGCVNTHRHAYAL